MKGGPASALTLSLGLSYVPLLHAQAASPSVRPPSPGDREIRQEVVAEDRRRMLVPPPPDFKPQGKEGRFAIELSLRDKVVRAGQPLWYRIVVRNVGGAPLRYREFDSFLKTPSGMGAMLWEFFLTPPDGKESLVIWGDFLRIQDRSHLPRRTVDVPDSTSMSESQVSEFVRRDQFQKRLEQNVDIILGPGEGLRSLPWRWVDAEEYLERLHKNEHDLSPRPPGEFSELFTGARLTRPGTYSLRLVRRSSRGSSRMPDKASISSAPVLFEVVP